jgi:hypothetical protein
MWQDGRTRRMRQAKALARRGGKQSGNVNEWKRWRMDFRAMPTRPRAMKTRNLVQIHRGWPEDTRGGHSRDPSAGKTGIKSLPTNAWPIKSWVIPEQETRNHSEWDRTCPGDRGSRWDGHPGCRATVIRCFLAGQRLRESTGLGLRMVRSYGLTAGGPRFAFRILSPRSDQEKREGGRTCIR